MSKRNNKRKKDASNLWGSQNSSILDFFSQTGKEHVVKTKKISKLDQDFPTLDSFTSSFDHSQRSNVTIDDVEGLSLNTQEAAFDVVFDTQDSHAWSEAISDIGDSDLVEPFLFDLDDDNINNNATETDSVVSNFSDILLPAEDLESNNDNESQRFNREISVDSFVSDIGSPVLGTSKNDVLPFDDDCSESVTSSFSTQEPPPPLADDLISTNANSTERSNDSMLPPLSDFRFIIPAPTAIMQRIAKEAPKPVTQCVKKEGLTDIALRNILKGIELHEKWEDAINAQLAKYGNIAKVCKEVDPEAVLFWIIDSWIEGGLIFTWCTLMEEQEIEDWITTKQEQEEKEEEEEENADPLICLMTRRNDEQDDTDANSKAIKRCPDPKFMAMTQGDGSFKAGETFLFAFSLAYIKSRKYAKKFIEQERVVAVWPDDCSELHVSLPRIGRCTANLTSKFKADSIY